MHDLRTAQFRSISNWPNEGAKRRTVPRLFAFCSCSQVIPRESRAITTFRVWHERQIRMTIHCAYDHLVRVGDLKPHPKNPNTHSAAQIAAIAAVIEGNGWRAPITVSNRSGFITRGHGRLEAALLLGCDQVPVDFQDYASEQAELADMLADNHLAELAEIDEDLLVGVLKELQAAGHDVGLAGFTEDEVARLTAVEEESAQLEPIPKMELQAAAAARRGHAFWDHSATLASALAAAGPSDTAAVRWWFQDAVRQ